MRLLTITAAVVWVVVFFVAHPYRGLAGDVMGPNQQSECTGYFGPGHVMCRSNYDPAFHERIFIRDIDETNNSTVRASMDVAEDTWNEVSPQIFRFDLVPNINDSFNFLKPKTAQQITARLQDEEAMGAGLTLMCNQTLPGDHCTVFLDEAVNAQWSDVWLSSDTNYQYSQYRFLDYLIMHEFGHAQGLAHHGESAGESLMHTPLDNLIEPDPNIEGGSTTNCKTPGTPTDLYGTRCIYNWYNCGDSDCDNIAALSDNCPSAPNQRQRNADGETLDLGNLFVFDDVTNIAGDTPGDICDDDDDGDGRSTADEIANTGCPSSTGSTDPLNDDSDGDLILDGIECLLGSNPLNATSKPIKTPGADGDRLADVYEVLFGTNPSVSDTDGDRLTDEVEVFRFRSNPTGLNTDGSIEPFPCRDNQEVASVNFDRYVNPGDQAALSSIIFYYGSGYPTFDHARRNFDMNREGFVNPGDQAIQAAILISYPIGGACVP